MEIYDAKTQADLEKLNKESKNDSKRILVELAKKLGVEIFFEDKTPLLDSSGIYCDIVIERPKHCSACGNSGLMCEKDGGFFKCPFCSDSEGRGLK